MKLILYIYIYNVGKNIQLFKRLKNYIHASHMYTYILSAGEKNAVKEIIYIYIYIYIYIIGWEVYICIHSSGGSPSYIIYSLC